MAIVITGANGFIGLRLVERLTRHEVSGAIGVSNNEDVSGAINTSSEPVRCLVRASSSTSKLSRYPVEIRITDFDDPEDMAAAVADASVVFHCAGCVASTDHKTMFSSNVGVTERLAAACCGLTPAPVMIYLSSLAAAGACPEGKILRQEWMSEQPVSAYGRSKLEAERTLRTYADRLPISVIRPAIVFGPEDRIGFLMHKCILDSGFHFGVGWCERYFSVIYVDDLTELMVRAWHRGSRLKPVESNYITSAQKDSVQYEKGLYFATSTDNPEYGQIGRTIGTCWNRRVRLWRFALPVFWTLASIADVWGHLRGRQMIINRDKAREASAGNWLCSGEKARQELDFTCGKPFELRMAETVQWYKENEWK